MEKPGLRRRQTQQSGYRQETGSFRQARFGRERTRAQTKANGAEANSSCARDHHRVSKARRFSPSMKSFPILEVQALTKSYATGGGQLTVLRDISFTLEAGATCSILGPSGSGKTTLLGLAAGLDLPTSGSVRLDGIALGEIGEDERARVRNQL